MDRREKAFEFASDASKQMITLSTGIIALTVTLLKDVATDAGGASGWLRWAWLAFGLSVFFGLWFLLALTGSLGSSRVSDADLSIYTSSARIPMYGQLGCFVVGLGFTIVFGTNGLRRDRATQPGPPAAPAAFVDRLLSVGPFADADTILTHGSWGAVEQSVLGAVKQRSRRTVVDGVLLLGGVDQRALSPAAARRFASNEALASARAEAVRARLVRLFGDSVPVFVIPVGAMEVGRAVEAMAQRRDRRVDVYLLSHAVGVPGPAR